MFFTATPVHSPTALPLPALLLTLLLQPIAMVVGGALMLGIINRVKSHAGGRKGPPLFQTLYDVAKLLRRGMVVSRTTTWVFFAGPVAGLVATLCAGMLVPFGGNPAVFFFQGDMILFVYLFALGRFFTTLAALDTGSPFEGMGAVREFTFACLAEISLLFGLLVLARLSNSLSLSGMFSGPAPMNLSAPGTIGALILVAISWAIVILAETCRIPFDDPNTHLELTMIHEVMVLDHGGPAFALVLLGQGMKMFVLGALLTNVLVPIRGGSVAATLLLFAGVMLLFAIAVGLVESTMARLRLIYIPKLLISAGMLSAFGAILLLR